MFVRIVLALMLGLCATTPVLAQGPIPSIEVPEQFKEPVDGYDMAIPYQIWRDWIEREKGPVTEQAMMQAETLEGRRPIGRPLFTAAFNNDYGRFATLEVRVYCAVTTEPYGFDRDDCSYHYRRADVPIHPSYRQTANPLDVWMRANFDPVLVVRNMKAAGLAPGANLWGNYAIFDDAPSPRAMLTEHLRIVRVDSRECPAFRTALEAVERAQPDWILDLYAVGEDERLRAPSPHAITGSYTLNTLVNGQNLTLTGGEVLHRLLGPVVRAASSCELERARRS